jgi:bifunctional DNase/RNase
MSFDAWKFTEATLEALTLSSAGFMVLLRLEGASKALPIFIGAPEAHAIAQAMGDGNFPRPLTHDLFKAGLDELGSEVVRALITEAQEGTFYARLVLSRDGEEFDLDARPSDAINMALRFSAPIFIDNDLWEAASVPFEPQEGSEEETPTRDTAEQLQARLEAALEAEQYEEAAKLRDELKRLRQGGN